MEQLSLINDRIVSRVYSHLSEIQLCGCFVIATMLLWKKNKRNHDSETCVISAGHRAAEFLCRIYSQTKMLRRFHLVHLHLEIWMPAEDVVCLFYFCVHVRLYINVKPEICSSV